MLIRTSRPRGIICRCRKKKKWKTCLGLGVAVGMGVEFGYVTVRVRVVGVVCKKKTKKCVGQPLVGGTCLIQRGFPRYPLVGSLFRDTIGVDATFYVFYIVYATHVFPGAPRPFARSVAFRFVFTVVGPFVCFVFQFIVFHPPVRSTRRSINVCVISQCVCVCVFLFFYFFTTGVAGGSIVQGVLRVGDEIEVRPGIVTKDHEGNVRVSLPRFRLGVVEGHGAANCWMG